MKLLTLAILLFSINLHADELEDGLEGFDQINESTKAPSRECPIDGEVTSKQVKKEDPFDIPSVSLDWKNNCKRILKNFLSKDTLKYALKGM